MWSLIICPLRFLKLDNTRKNDSKLFFSLEILPFVSKICNFDNLLGPEKCSYKMYSNGIRKLLDPYYKSPEVCHTRYHEKKRLQTIFLTGKVAFFSKACVFNNLWGPDERILYFHSNCHNTLWTFIDCSLSFIMLDNTGKFGQIFCFTRSFAFFSQKFVFSTTS